MTLLLYDLIKDLDLLTLLLSGLANDLDLLTFLVSGPANDLDLLTLLVSGLANYLDVLTLLLSGLANDLDLLTLLLEHGLLLGDEVGHGDDGGHHGVAFHLLLQRLDADLVVLPLLFKQQVRFLLLLPVLLLQRHQLGLHLLAQVHTLLLQQLKLCVRPVHRLCNSIPKVNMGFFSFNINVKIEIFAHFNICVNAII